MTTGDARTISVTGDGLASAVPDMVTVTLGVNVLGASVAEAMAGSSDGANAILTALRNRGVADADMQTTNFSLRDEIDHRGNEPRLIGYRVNNSVHATIRKIDDLGSILQEVAEAGGDVTTINGVNFAHSDLGVLDAEARRLAFADAKAKASQLADHAGATLGTVQSITEGDFSDGPMPRGGVMMRSSMAPPIEAGEVAHQVSLEVVFKLLDNGPA